MIAVKLFDKFIAIFNRQWTSDDNVIEEALNQLFNIDEVGPSILFTRSITNKRVFGFDGFALDSISFLNPEILTYEPVEIEGPQNGVVI